MLLFSLHVSYRVTRSGRLFNLTVFENTIIVPNVNLQELLGRRAEQDSDSESGEEDESEEVPIFHFGKCQSSSFFDTTSPLSSSTAPSTSGSKRPPEDRSLCGSSAKKLHLATSSEQNTASLTNDNNVIHGTNEQRKHDKKHRKNDRRRAKRREERDNARVDHRKALCHLRVQQTKPIPIPGEFRFTEHRRPVASTGWMGLRDTAIINAADCDEEGVVLPEARAYTKEEIMHLSMGMHYVDWDGVPGPLVDTEGTAFALLAGGPRDPNWTAKVADEAAKRMQEAAKQIWGESAEVYTLPKRYRKKGAGKNNKAPQSFPASLFPPSELPRRGPFYAKIAGFVNGMFESYAPQLHAYYRTTMESLYREMPNLPRNYDEFTSVFAAATFNFGPWTITFPHLDFANLAWGWCAVTALGAFDPDKGDHLILWDLRLVIRFPPGCTILIPSAILRHSNVSIQQGEMRYSFTQYTAAGIFRYVANGFRTEKQVDLSKMSKAEKVQRVEERKNRWFKGMKMYSKYIVESQ
ncbi:hypothetical protein B0H13DRAFT_2344770 [Mycena leptocephala]|nr:hypothetical protein B0H13DRAFT_2344770 [Mycena leptocephala]